METITAYPPPPDQHSKVDSSPSAFAVGGELDKAIHSILTSEEEAILERVNERLLRLAFARNGQNQVRTAKALGVSRNALRTWLKRFGMIR